MHSTFPSPPLAPQLCVSYEHAQLSASKAEGLARAALVAEAEGLRVQHRVQLAAAAETHRRELTSAVRQAQEVSACLRGTVGRGAVVRPWLPSSQPLCSSLQAPALCPALLLQAHGHCPLGSD